MNFPLSTYSVFGEKNVSQERQIFSSNEERTILSADGDKTRAALLQDETERVAAHIA